MKFIKIKKVLNGIDSVLIEKKVFVIRFSARHAQHIIENIDDSAHNISFSEIVQLIKNSLFLPLESNKKQLFLGRHKGKIYETYFYLEKQRIDVVTSFICNKPPFIEKYKEYEKNTR